MFPFYLIKEIVTSPFGRSKGVSFGKLWEVQSYCFFSSSCEGIRYPSFGRIKGYLFGMTSDITVFSFRLVEEIDASFFGMSKGVPFGRLWKVQ